MDPEGKTDRLLSEHPEDVTIELKLSFEKGSDSNVKYLQADCYDTDAMEPYTSDESLNPIPPMQKISLLAQSNRCDASTIGSYDPMCLNSQSIDDSENSANASSNINQVFRGSIMPKIPGVTSTTICGARNSYDEETTLYLCEDIIDSFSCNENEDNDEKMVETIPKNDCYERQLLISIKINSVIVGLLLGLFIQFSTLGANFLVTSYTFNTASQNDDADSTEFNILAFNMIWSFFASFLGVLFMLIMRCLFSTMYQDSASNIRNTHLLHMECFLSAGALIGVCLAWIGTDGFLDVNAHLMLSALTLAGALIWCKILSYLLQNRQKVADGSVDDVRSMMKSPLLPKKTNRMDTKNMKTTLTTLSKVKIIGSILGFMIGLFIQFSSLGINFLLQAVYRDVDSSTDFMNVRDPLLLSVGTDEEIKKIIIRISFLWSFITSFIGVILLIVIRCMVTNVLSTFNMKRLSIVPSLTNDQDKLILNLECFFAFGATFGLNLSWTLTDCLLGLNNHILQSVLTLLGTIIWCKLVMCFFGKHRSNESEDIQVKSMKQTKKFAIAIV